jgi:23S rRNA G2445 N2-methylase RlmL
MATSKADLKGLVSDPGFTPPVRRLAELHDLFGEEDEQLAKDAARAVLRIEAQYASRVAKETVERARASTRPARGRLTQLASRFAHEKRDPDGAALGWLLEALGDDDPKTRRAAARGLGKLERTPEIEKALADAFDRSTVDDDKRALAMALGKVGGEAARTRLAGGDHGRASVIAERELARETAGAGEIDPSRSPAKPLRIWFHTRSGLEQVLQEELGTDFGRPRFVSPGIVEAELAGPLKKALAVRTALHVGFPLEVVDKKDLAHDIVDALASSEAEGIFGSFTSSAQIRFRLEFARGGHRRAVAWSVAELVRTAGRDRSDGAPRLVNDPRSSPWEVVVDEVGAHVKLELVPRGHVDERFAYRRDLVAASSHPTIAAAIARIAPRRDDDVVWDPFAGAGAELVERARLGPYARLVGTDVDPGAVAAARANLARAGVTRATIEEADASLFTPKNVTLILTNPPMGRRVQRGTHADLLERFVRHAADVLIPGGALVWLVPEPRPIRERAEAVGLLVNRAFSVDMGGFSAELVVFVKPVERKRRIVESPSPRPAKNGAKPPRRPR